MQQIKGLHYLILIMSGIRYSCGTFQGKRIPDPELAIITHDGSRYNVYLTDRYVRPVTEYMKGLGRASINVDCVEVCAYPVEGFAGVELRVRSRDYIDEDAVPDIRQVMAKVLETTADKVRFYPIKII